MRRSLTFASAISMLTASACSISGEPPDTPDSSSSGPPLQAPDTTSPANKRPPLVAAPVAHDQTPPVIDGQVPAELIAQLREDLAKHTGGAAADARLISAQSVVWPNGSLGCAQPGQMYTQALVPGYRVQFEAGGQTFSYHASKKGYFKLCPNTIPRVPRGAD